MAKKSMIVKAERKRENVRRAMLSGKKATMGIRAYNCCNQCGRTRSYFRFFGLCRMCLREHARRGDIPGLKKSSW